MASLVKFLSNGVLFAANRSLILQPSSVSNNLAACYSSKFGQVVNKLGLPEPPKRPITGFIRYQQENLSAFLPNAKSHTEAVALAGAQWKKMSEEQKEKYNKQFKTEFAEYRKLYTAYMNRLTPEQKNAIKTERKALDEALEHAAEKRTLRKEKDALGKPKQPVPAFLLFAAAKCKSAGSSAKPADFKDEWNRLSEEQKQAYKRKVQEQRDAYEKELKSWEDKMIREGKPHLVRKTRILTKKNVGDKHARKPKTE